MSATPEAAYYNSHYLQHATLSPVNLKTCIAGCRTFQWILQRAQSNRKFSEASPASYNKWWIPVTSRWGPLHFSYFFVQLDKYDIIPSFQGFLLHIVLAAFLKRSSQRQNSTAHLATHWESTWMGHCCLDERGWHCALIWPNCRTVSQHVPKGWVKKQLNILWPSNKDDGQQSKPNMP